MNYNLLNNVFIPSYTERLIICKQHFIQNAYGLVSMASAMLAPPSVVIGGRQQASSKFCTPKIFSAMALTCPVILEAVCGPATN